MIFKVISIPSYNENVWLSTVQCDSSDMYAYNVFKTWINEPWKGEHNLLLKTQSQHYTIGGFQEVESEFRPE